MGKTITMKDIEGFGYATEDFVVETAQAAMENIPQGSWKTAEPFTLAAGFDYQSAWHFLPDEHGDGIPLIYVVAKYVDENGEEVYIPAKYDINARTSGYIIIRVYRTIENTDMTFYIMSNYQPYNGSGM